MELVVIFRVLVGIGLVVGSNIRYGVGFTEELASCFSVDAVLLGYTLGTFPYLHTHISPHIHPHRIVRVRVNILILFGYRFAIFFLRLFVVLA